MLADGKCSMLLVMATYCSNFNHVDIMYINIHYKGRGLIWAEHFLQGAVHCPYYMKTGTCKYGATCKFDHPPPGEVMAISALDGTSTAVGEEVKGDEKESEVAPSTAVWH